MSAWTNQIWKSAIAKRGGVVRRKVTSIQRFSSLAHLKAECKRRKFHVVEHRGQWLIFCDKGAVKIIL